MMGAAILPWSTVSAYAMQWAVAVPGPKASAAGGATKQSEAKAVRKIESLK